MVSAPVFVELAAMPTINPQRAEKLLADMHIAVDFDLGEDVWRRCSDGGSPKRLLADFVIAAHALPKTDRLMTQDTDRYAQDFPKLRIV